MAVTKQISATIKNHIVEETALMAMSETRSFSQMVEILLEEALKNRKKKK